MFNVNVIFNLHVYTVFHNNLPKIIAYCSKIKCPGDSLDLLPAQQNAAETLLETF